MLNPALDTAALAARFAMKKRVQIADCLTGAAADDLHTVLTRATPWELVYYDRGNVVRLAPDAMRALSAEERGRRIAEIYERARDNFGFLYQANLMADNYASGRDPAHPLNRVFEFLNSAPFLGLVRAVTGVESVVKADAQATLYVPGHFLNSHDDQIQGHKRRIAYVLNMSRNWNADWGGLLQFYDSDRNVDQVFVPRFNSLSLFAVPQDHAVTTVAPYAGLGRFAITGWFIDP
jgi:Rps23 Pro-64 3,4-dihydroxylase Tpa1-like proline 4-hydroxylase